jgi:hypothetical protein
MRQYHGVYLYISGRLVRCCLTKPVKHGVLHTFEPEGAWSEWITPTILPGERGQKYRASGSRTPYYDTKLK